MYDYIYSSIICNSQKLEVTQISINIRAINELWHIQMME